jgi:hypothetical protein
MGDDGSSYKSINQPSFLYALHINPSFNLHLYGQELDGETMALHRNLSINLLFVWARS